MLTTSSNKSKIAKRVIEVLDFFDNDHPRATVMDIVRRYDRPQSSTSELLSSLVEMGLLYKDNATRSYALTPRAAMLGSLTQPDFVRDGRLNALIHDLSARTNLSVGVFGMVGLQTQVFCWNNGEPPLRASTAKGIYSGMQERLSDSAVGHLLLSTVEKKVRDGMLRRLNAEATPEKQFLASEMITSIEQAAKDGYVCGPAGFGSIADVCAVLVPDKRLHRPLALGIAFEPSEGVAVDDLIALLRQAVRTCAARADSSHYPTYAA